MKPHEEVVIQQYIDKCIVFHSVSMFMFYFVTFGTIVVLPIVTNQMFPTLVEYPFDVSYQPLKTHQPIPLLVQFSGLGIISLMEVFMFVWPGEHLISMCKNVAEAAYDVFKCNRSIKITKCLQIIIMRCQKPVIVSIPCLMPILSFNYFTTYCSTILSYFTTLRVMMENDYN
ncbi:uncharacterized protein [Mycetomoellerius zeteki]|uniref:uncharacterized protein n=1 Tax=Mycetomoellerius zeteki TaxID=64791 RepID=UPI00084E72D7|nr:PREDICTED: uncharacterized protein LOC108723890 [Trachymyrmex zeteki]